MANAKKIAQSLKSHEGFSKEVYKCTAGVETIGYGFALKDLNATERAIWGRELRLTQDEVKGVIDAGAYHLLYMNRETADEILEFKVAACLKAAFAAWQWLAYREEALQEAFCEWIFQLGLNGVKGFKKSLALIEAGEYEKASIEVLNSRWAKQTPKRAKALSEVLKTCKLKGNGVLKALNSVSARCE